MDTNIRQILERPFDRELIRTREGPGGMQLSYVEIQAYITRLNEAFDADWSFELISREQVEDQVVVEGRLTAGRVVKTGLGGSAVTRRKDNGRLVSIADDYKRAEADSLKRCCRLLGIGAGLYGDAAGEDCEEPAPPAKMATRNTDAVAGADRISSAQIAKLRHVIADLGGDWSSYRVEVRERLGANVEFISKRAASTLIDELVAQSRRRGTNGNGKGGNHGRDADHA